MTNELHRSMRRSIYYPDGSGPRLELIYRSGSPASEPEVALSDGSTSVLLRPEDIDTLRDWLYVARSEHKEYLDDRVEAEAKAEAEGAGALD